jgi:hypothetical protein
MDINFSRDRDERRNIIYKYFGLPCCSDEDLVNKSEHEKRFRYLKNLLDNGELFFSAPREVNDIFDSLIDYKFVGLEKDIESWFDKFLKM